MAAAAARGKQALDLRDYEGAIREYTAAIKESPTSPDFYTQRSVAYQRAQKHKEALADAEQAVLNGQQRAKKEAIIEAQFRRGVALYGLQRFGDADFILKRAKAMATKHNLVDMWIGKTALEIKKLPEDDERRKCTITETPSGAASKAAPPPKPAAPQQTPKDKIRYEWYQNSENIYFTLLAKGVPKDHQTRILIQERTLIVCFPTIDDDLYELGLEPLFAPVDPDKSITRIMSTKIEVILSKVTPGLKWPALESSEPMVRPTYVSGPESAEDVAIGKALAAQAKAAEAALAPAPAPAPAPARASARASAPAYPTSSKNGPKDWDKIARDSRRAEKTATDGEEAADAGKDDDSDDEGGDASNKFFKMLYKNASPDMQRAMMKSYTESGGTSLSTNWDEVKKGKVEVCPPDGMEAKSWN